MKLVQSNVMREKHQVSKGGVCAGWWCVCGIRVFTAGEVKAVNGTDVRLKCTFQSSAAIRASSVTVSWSFRPLGPGHVETVRPEFNSSLFV